MKYQNQSDYCINIPQKLKSSLWIGITYTTHIQYYKKWWVLIQVFLSLFIPVIIVSILQITSLSFGVIDLMVTQFHLTSAAANCIDELKKCTPCLEENIHIIYALSSVLQKYINFFLQCNSCMYHKTPAEIVIERVHI